MLGSRDIPDYPQWERDIIGKISALLKKRDPYHEREFHALINNLNPPSRRPMGPRDWNYLYAKAASAIWETAKALASYELHPHMRQRSPVHWLNTILKTEFTESVDARPSGPRGDRDGAALSGAASHSASTRHSLESTALPSAQAKPCPEGTGHSGE